MFAVDREMRRVVRMVPATLRIGRRELHYALSDNVDASPVWAVNLHGYFAGGRMYWRESARLASDLGWRVVVPSLPGFGGSSPLGWHEVTLASMAQHVARLMDHVGAGPAVVLGHSMGAAVAVRYATDHPEATLGVIYRDGVATPQWKERSGLVPQVVAPLSPTMAPFVDFAAAVVCDMPDLLVGRALSTMRALVPDFHRNVRAMGTTLPVGSMLMAVDLRQEVADLAASGMPLLAEWGCFDRVVGAATAAEFARVAGMEIQWLPGGHSWMLARPQGQADVLRHLPSGRRFLARTEARRLRWQARYASAPAASASAQV